VAATVLAATVLAATVLSAMVPRPERGEKLGR
jgi:hypothetical protein